MSRPSTMLSIVISTELVIRRSSRMIDGGMLGKTSLTWRTCLHTIVRYSMVWFNVPIDTFIGHFGDDFTVRRPNEQCHITEGQWLVKQVKGQYQKAQVTNRSRM